MIGLAGPDQIPDVLRDPVRYGLNRCAACEASPVAGAGLYLVSERVARCLGQPRVRCRIFAFCAACIADQERALGQMEERILRAAERRRAQWQ
jgi:hypothetical protein